MYCEYRLRNRPAPSTQSSQIIVCFLGAGEYHLRQTYVIGSPAGEHFLRPECSTWLYSLGWDIIKLIMKQVGIELQQKKDSAPSYRFIKIIRNTKLNLSTFRRYSNITWGKNVPQALRLHLPWLFYINVHFHTESETGWRCSRIWYM